MIHIFELRGTIKLSERGLIPTLSYANVCLTHFSKRINKLWIEQT